MTTYNSLLAAVPSFRLVWTGRKGRGFNAARALTSRRVLLGDRERRDRRGRQVLPLALGSRESACSGALGRAGMARDSPRGADRAADRLRELETSGPQRRRPAGNLAVSGDEGWGSDFTPGSGIVSELEKMAPAGDVCRRARMEISGTNGQAGEAHDRENPSAHAPRQAPQRAASRAGRPPTCPALGVVGPRPQRRQGTTLATGVPRSRSPTHFRRGVAPTFSL